MPVDLAQFGASGAVVVVVLLFLKFMKEAEVRRDLTYDRVASVLEDLKQATDKNTAATTSADTYLRQRNGRDNEHHAEVLKDLKAIPKTMKTIAAVQAKAIITAVHGDQKIEHQTVAHQTVEHKKK